MADTMKFPGLSLMSLAGSWTLCHEGKAHRHIMNLAQSPHIPAQGQKPAWKDVPWLTAFALRGFGELVRARVVFMGLKARSIPLRNKAAFDRADRAVSLPPKTLARMSYVLPRLSDRLPWRSDCLIQAIAAQNWLMAHGAAGEIQIGVENPKDGKFAAHAWLMHDGMIVTGGDIAQYETILADSRSGGDSLYDSGSDTGG